MAELLKRWVNELGVTPVVNFEKDLANGFIYGEILAHPAHDLLTAEAFAAFMSSDSAEAKAAGWAGGGLWHARRPRGVPAGGQVRKQGVALRLLHQIKQALQTLQQNVFSSSNKASYPGCQRRLTQGWQVLDFDPADTQTLNEAGSVAYLSGSKTLGKTRYEDIEKTRFDDRMRKMVPNSYEQKLTAHLKHFQDHAESVDEKNRILHEEDMMRESQDKIDRRQVMRDKYLQNKQFNAEWQSQGLAIHRQNQLNRRGEVKREIAFEMAQSQNVVNRESRGRASAREMVVDSIDSFETTLRRLGKLETEALSEETIREKCKAPETTALERMRTIEHSLADFGDMQSAANAHIRTLKKKKAEEDASRKERDQRRRKVLLDQQSAQKELEERRREEMLLEKLCRQSREERKLAESLWECQLHKDLMRENRVFRDKQEKAQAARDKQLKLEAEKAIRAQAYDEYQRQVAETVRRRDEFEAKLQEEKTAKHEALGLEVMESVLDLVARIELHKEKTDGLWPDEEYVEWCNSLQAGQSLWPPPPEEPDPAELARMEQEAADLHDPVRVADSKRLDNMEWLRYLSWTGVWGFQQEGQPKPGQTEPQPPPCGSQNQFLCDAVQQLQLAIAPVVPQQAPPVMPKFPIRACILGKPYAGKSALSIAMEQKLGCKRLSPDVLVTEAIDSYRAVIFDEDVAEKVAQDKTLQLGKQAFEQLAEGLGVDDATIVALLVHVIQMLDTQMSEDGTTPVGWVLDGFPCTVQQAKLFEQSASGYVEPTEPSSAFSSQLVAAQAGSEDSSRESVKPAIGMVIVLEIEDLAVERRAHGHMVDIEDNLRRYHLSSDPPELGENKFLNLVPEENESSADLHIGPRMRCYQENERPLLQFFGEFGVVERIDGAPNLPDVEQVVEEKLKDLEYQFNDLKDREFRTRPPTDLTGWGEDIKGPEVDQELNEEESTKLKEQQVAELLLTQWMAVEKEVTSKSKAVFSAIRAIRQNAVAHYAELKEAFAEYLHRPDQRAMEAVRFQDGFNSIEEWMRSDVEVKQELHLRADELQERLWDVSDQARAASDEERYSLLGDGWLQDKCAECTFQLTKLIQMEVLRYQAASMLLETRDMFIKTGQLPAKMDLLQHTQQLIQCEAVWERLILYPGAHCLTLVWHYADALINHKVGAVQLDIVYQHLLCLDGFPHKLDKPSGARYLTLVPVVQPL